ncbi:hypothetical protein EYZ11_010404 [Aspergillus tanneri]|uniref:Uncharacterized protein n=1 Tax=Aspergillus tanneri TaxID=1220188 RepID=A0A4S3J7K9_9EURO|nr:hypothetical protein EYZ11_010404 [Aspergillus tanneri]
MADLPTLDFPVDRVPRGRLESLSGDVVTIDMEYG